MTAAVVPLRCRHGWHSWRFVSMSDARPVDIPMRTVHLCTLLERCRRCKLRRVSASAPTPKRVRT